MSTREPRMAYVGELNTNILKSIHWLIYLLGVPFILGVDFNLNKQVVAEADWPQPLKAGVLGPNTITHTQTNQEYDYFLISEQLVSEVTQPFLLPEGH